MQEPKTIPCVFCGTQMRQHHETVRWDLPGVTLRDVPVYSCDGCGERMVGYPDVNGLIGVLVGLVLDKPAPLTGPEVRFLRTHLGWTGPELAAVMGTTPETVSRWEHGRIRLHAAADRLLRLVVAEERGVHVYERERFTRIGSEAPAPLRAVLAHDGERWIVIEPDRAAA